MGVVKLADYRPSDPVVERNVAWLRQTIKYAA